MSFWLRQTLKRFKKPFTSSLPILTRSSNSRKSFHDFIEDLPDLILLIRPYPIRRILPLVEAISSDFNDQLLKVLSSQRLMYMDYAKFEEAMTTAAAVFGTWDENMKDFTNVAREGIYMMVLPTLMGIATD